MSVEEPEGTAAEGVSDESIAERLEDLRAQIDLLQEENSRLRREYARARQSQYRRTALGLALLGLVGVGGGVLFPAARPVLFALGATGLFAGLLTYYLTPEQVIPASVGERVYAALATNGAALVADLGLTDRRVYVPTGDADDPVRLFVPQRAEYDLPAADDLRRAFVVTTDERTRGVSLRPTGLALYDEFERTLAGPPADDPAPLADQLVDGLVEQFELVDACRVDARPDTGHLTVGVTGSAYGPIDRFDHPVPSFLAVGLARQVERPIEVEVGPGDDRVDYLVTCELPEAESATDE